MDAEQEGDEAAEAGIGRRPTRLAAASAARAQETADEDKLKDVSARKGGSQEGMRPGAGSVGGAGAGPVSETCCLGQWI